MVDDVLVKLDEIETHVLKTQADVDRLMRDFSKPDKGKELLAQLPSGGGGFFDQLVKAISGGKGSGIMSAGLAGGAAAGGIMVLVDVIKEAIGNSKILTTILGTIGQALGLLIDVILLPFLPILITGIIWLYQGIMIFHKLWSEIWASKAMQLIGSGLATLGGFLAKGLADQIQFYFNLAGAAVDLSWKILTWLYDLNKTGGQMVLGLAFTAAGMFWDFLVWFWGFVNNLSARQIKLEFSALGAVYDFLKWVQEIVATGANLVLSLVLTGRPQDKAFWDQIGLGGVFQAGSDFMGWAKSIPFLDSGGTIAQTGIAVVHAGETVVPAGQGGGITINIPNYVGSKSDLTKVITDALRQQQYRYQA